MGLDMYLTAKVYGKDIKLEKTLEVLDDCKVSEVSIEVGYWRKANAIHGWFVRNVQGGEDDCKDYPVGMESLLTLKDKCLRILLTKDGSILPPYSGPFFGSYEINDDYFADIKETVNIIEKAEELYKAFESSGGRNYIEFSYYSSW